MDGRTILKKHRSDVIHPSPLNGQPIPTSQPNPLTHAESSAPSPGGDTNTKAP